MALPARPATRLLVLLAAVAIAVAGTYFGLRTTAAATVEVDAGNNYFCSGAYIGTVCETDITAGDTVTWTLSGGTHTITLCSEDYAACPPAGGWDSGLLTNGHSYSQTFAEPGTYAYRCELHPSEMLGKIVAAAATPSPTAVATPSPTEQVTAAPTSEATAVALPKTGGDPSGSTDSALAVVAGAALLVIGALAFAGARKRT